MDGYLAEIRMFAADFAPRGWAFCAGQLLPISANNALFALIGQSYGGDGKVTFALPDLRGRTVIGTGFGPGLSNRKQGQIVGREIETLTIKEIPHHGHKAALTNGSAQLYTSSELGTANEPSPGSVISAESGGAAFLYGKGDPNIEMATKSIQNVAGDVEVQNVGGNEPHNNMQPSLVINYIICVQGLFPSKN